MKSKIVKVKSFYNYLTYHLSAITELNFFGVTLMYRMAQEGYLERTWVGSRRSLILASYCLKLRYKIFINFLRFLGAELLDL